MNIDPLIVDVYQGDGPKDWQALAAAGPPWHGAILKATQGTYYNGAGWFEANWRGVRAVEAGRAGTTWFRGAYHYLDMRIDGARQAAYFLNAVANAGGWTDGDLCPMLDVERAGQREGIGAAQVIDCAGAFVERIRRDTGRDTMLYGGSFLADLAITNRMGARWLAIARYTQTLPIAALTRIGWDLESLALWQYCGDGVARLDGYPREAPGCGKVDISALVLPGGVAALRQQVTASSAGSR